MEWEFNLPVKLVFGNGKRRDIKKYINEVLAKAGSKAEVTASEVNGQVFKYV